MGSNTGTNHLRAHPKKIIIKSQVAADNAIFKKLNLNANMGLGR